MTRRNRTALLLSAAAALAVPASAAAIATPTLPALADPPEFAIGTSFTPSWSASVFTPSAINKGYELDVWDVMSGTHELRIVGAPDTASTFVGRQNGHSYRIRIRGREVRCTLELNNICLTTQVVTSIWSGWSETRTDLTDPTGSVAINGGATYATKRDATLNLTASDPLSSGVGGVQISTDGAFSCNIITDAAECPVGFAAAKPFVLPEGPDGVRTVWVKYRDNARSYAPKGLIVSLGAQGNDSPAYQDSITLDRSQPTPVVTMGVPAADAGVPVAFSASSSTDATSGVNTGSAIWDFGDGTAPVHALQLNKSFAAPGTYAGSLTISDKAGNTNTQAFSFTVTGAPSATGGGVQVTDPGVQESAGGMPQTTPGGTTVPGPTVDDPIRGARRLGRAVQGKQLRIRVRVAARIPVRVTILRVTGAGKSVVRRATKTGGPGFVVFTFTAPRAGRHVVRVAAGSDRLTFPMGIAKR